jgi:hypothetical protein
MKKKDIENKGIKKKIRNKQKENSKKKLQNFKIVRKRKVKHIYKINEINSQKLKEEKIEYKSDDKLVDKLFSLKNVSGALFNKIQ